MAGPIGPNIGTSTDWDYAIKIGTVGNRESALMRALREQIYTQHHLSSIGAQRAGPIEPQIGTKTHWGNGHKLWGWACA
jgi:hypothetical protein